MSETANRNPTEARGAPRAEQAVTTMQPKRASFVPLAKVTSIQEMFDHPEFFNRIKQTLPGHLNPNRMLRVFTQSMLRTPKLRECSPMSLMGAMLTASQLGLEPNTPLGHAYLIPFEVNKWNPGTRQRELIRVDVQLVLGYPGLIDLSYRTKLVRSIHADVVWPGDEFSFHYGTDAHVRHRPLGHERAENVRPEWAYAHATLIDGQAFEVMPYSEVLLIRNRSQGYRAALAAKQKADEKGYRTPSAYTDAPWIQHEIAMARKTVFRQLSKWLPRSVEMSGLAAAVALDEQQERGGVNWADVVTDNANVIEGGLSDAGDMGDDDPSGGGDQGGGGAPPTQSRERSATTTSKPATTRKAAPPKQDDAPPAGHPAAGEDDGLAGDAAALRESTGASDQQPAADADDDWMLCDAFGELIDVDELNTPIQFAEAFADLLSKHPDQRANIIENNADMWQLASQRSAEAKAIIDEAMAPRDEPSGEDDGNQPGDLPDKWRVECPLNALGKPHYPGFIGNLKQGLASVASAADMEAFIAANADEIGRLPTMARNNAQTAISDHLAALGLSTLDGGAVAPKTDAAPDVDATWANGMKGDMEDAKDTRRLELLFENAAVAARVERLKRERPELHKELQDAYRARKAALTAQI